MEKRKKGNVGGEHIRTVGVLLGTKVPDWISWSRSGT